MHTPIAEVVLDSGLEQPLDYALPPESTAKVGMRVEVPLRGKNVKGTILALKNSSPFTKIQPIKNLLNEKLLLSDELLQLALWISRYYCAPIGKVLKTMLPPSLRSDEQKEKVQKFVKPSLSLNQLKEKCEELRRKHPAQAKILDVLLEHPKGVLLSELLERAEVSHAPLQTLVKHQIVTLIPLNIDRSLLKEDFFPTQPKKLSGEQESALGAILKSTGSFNVHLLHGVTGSGKTEIYLQAAQHILNDGKGVIYLVPEIALTSQTIERFRGRFKAEDIAVLHHRLSDGQRYDAWQRIARGEAKIVIGARSAIFSPVNNLGMIIVDEEQESSYKQGEEAPKYHARDVAIVRGKFAKCPVVLGSATPSLETYSNAMEGKYQLHVLKNRPTSSQLAKVTLVDMAWEFTKAKGFTLFSEPLINKIQDRLRRGEQTLLFLNRRGYHTSAQCPKCAHIVRCPHCEISLTYHRGDEILACHLCDYRLIPPRSCPSCFADGPLKFKGAGTELIERSLHALLPEIRTLRLDADTTRHKGSHERLFKQFRSGKADVLIGTQMIAKGLHFPLVTLVGVIGIDGSLNIPDFRAGENAFQILTQVAGRSGRGELPGEVVIQTHLPHHSIIQQAANQDYESFYAEEIEVRKTFGFPPFTHLIKFSFAADNEAKCQQTAKQFRESLIALLPKNVEILPVIPCGYAKIKGNYRFQCIIKTEKILRILPQIEKLRWEFKNRGDVRLSIDVDPLTTFF